MVADDISKFGSHKIHAYCTSTCRWQKKPTLRCYEASHTHAPIKQPIRFAIAEDDRYIF
ncbi:unnamed protein product, partial [Callosobruchus maculatus]